MLANEKEYNGNLFDQLSILERIEAVTEDEAALKQIAIERRQIERKLYQSPSLQKNRITEQNNDKKVSSSVGTFFILNPFLTIRMTRIILFL